MQTSALILIAGMCFFCQLSFGLPRFTGMRQDDSPVFEGFLSSAHDKNINVEISDIGDVELDKDEMLIRIYAGFGTQPMRRGGHPLDLYELHLKGEEVSILWFPPCPGGPELTRGQPLTAWRTLQEQDFFTIRDSRTFPDYPGVLDGTTYLVQIKSQDAYREFTISDPDLYQSKDNSRLETTLAAIAAEFEDAACLRPGFSL